MRWLWMGLVLLLSVAGQAAEVTLPLAEDEVWWGGAVRDAGVMPFGDDLYVLDQDGNTSGNQSQPMLISTRGRWVWCDEPMTIVFQDDELSLRSDSVAIEHGTAGSTLRDAYRFVSRNFFPPGGQIPDPRLFETPIYNTWIELGYEQTQEGVLRYARQALEHGFPPGVLVIDDNWQQDYGTWEFRADRFPQPRLMVDALQRMGFAVMLWVAPFVSPDSEVGRDLMRRRLLVGADMNLRTPFITRWWNGYSAVLDCTNPEAVAWMNARLHHLLEAYGVDGFKFDGGDAGFYPEGSFFYEEEAVANRQSEAFAALGLAYPMNEFRATWKQGGQPLLQRLRDKRHSWDDLQELVPGILAQGLMGYPFSCPDLIGGGEIRSFQHLDTIDGELIVRSAQCHALMPAMQFSVAPWRVLDEDHLEACRQAARLHVHYGERILELAHEAAQTGEPIVRSMEYVWPHQGYSRVVDQFVLGDDLLVAPVVEAGARSRTVLIPPGRWEGDDGTRYQGPARVEIAAPLERLPRFLRID